jgi:undecaprenyl-diphosphatase
MTFNFVNFAASISQYPTLAYGAVFLVSISESLALVGLLVPGTIIMFGVGAVVATGSLGLMPVLLLAAAGAICGDGISYWLGHHYQDGLRRMWPFSGYPGMLQNGEAFFHRHGGKSVLFGRFVGPVRPVIPVVAGMLGMAPLHFAVVNVLSAVGWALAYILPGVFFGNSLAVAGAVSSRLALTILLVALSCWFFVWLGRRLVLVAVRRGPDLLGRLQSWAEGGSTDQGALRTLKRTITYLSRDQGGEEWFVGLMAVAILGAGWAFLGILQDVMAQDPLVLTDQAVYHFFQSLRTPWANQIMVAVTELGDAFVNASLTVVVLLVLLGRRCYRAAGFFFLAMAGGSLGVQALKWLIHLPRPVDIYHGASAYGFPSGHTTMSVVLYGFLAILMLRGLKGTWRWGLITGALFFSFLIAFSRLYLGAHWLSDVMGGFFIGITWTAFLGIIYHRKADNAIPRRMLTTLVILVVLGAGGWHIGERHAGDIKFYAPRHQPINISLAAWQGGGWRSLPAWRVDMAGELEQPLTIQWVAPLVELKRNLISAGWRRPPSMGLKNILGIFAPDTPLNDLPILPHLHNGRAESLLLMRRVVDGRLLLRLWSSDIMIDGKTPLWLGSIERQNRYHLTGLITLARGDRIYSRANLTENINNSSRMRSLFSSQLVWRGSRQYEGDEYTRARWQGGTLLLWSVGNR